MSICYHCCVIFHYVTKPQFISSFYYYPTLQFGANKSSAKINSLVQVFWWTCVCILSGVDLEVEVLGHRVSVCSTLVSGCVNLYSLQQSKGVAPLTFQHLSVIDFFCFGHTSEYVSVLHYGFGVLWSDDQWSWTLINTFTCNLNILFCKVLVLVFCLFSYRSVWLFCIDF